MVPWTVQVPPMLNGVPDVSVQVRGALESCVVPVEPAEVKEPQVVLLAVLKMPEEALFNAVLMQKDLQLALEQGRAVGVPLPSTSLTHEMLTAARGLGLADKDFAAVFDVLARMSGLPGSC